MNARNASLHGYFNLYIFKYGDGKTTWIEEEVAQPGSFTITFKDITDATHERWSKAYQTLEATVVTIDELQRMTTVAEDDDADPEKMMKEFVEKKRKCGVKEDEYRRPKNQPHNLHRVDEKNAPTEYHNDFGSDLLACAKGMNDHDFNSAHVGVWSGFGFHAVVPVGFSGSHVTLEPSDDNMLTLPQFLNGLKKIGIKKLSDVKTLDIYGEDSEYAGFEWDRNSIMKVICLKFSSKNNTPNPKDMLKDFMSEEDSKNEFEGESEELNESMVRFCDRLIRG